MCSIFIMIQLWLFNISINDFFPDVWMKLFLNLQVQGTSYFLLLNSNDYIFLIAFSDNLSVYVLLILQSLVTLALQHNSVKLCDHAGILEENKCLLFLL